MILYCYKCERCKEKWEELRPMGDHPKIHRCLDSNWTSFDFGKIVRDYAAETKVVISDWESGFNVSAGVHYKNKKDLFTKMKNMGMYPSAHGGGITGRYKEYYGDEQDHLACEQKVHDDPKVDKMVADGLGEGAGFNESIK